MLENLENIWLPYTQHSFGFEPLKVADAQGSKITLEDKRELIDGNSNWWTACHGHKHPHLIKAVQEQAEKLPHMMFGNFANEPAYKLANRLAKLTKLPKVFLSDSGSTAIEAALKIAVQYWRNQSKNTKKCKFMNFRNAYHGDTMGAMSVSYREGMHSPYSGHVPMQFVSKIPSGELGFEEFEELLKATSNQLAGVIIEPLVQCAGGMKFHSPDVLAEIYRITKKHDLLFIADEVATGFGRTGYMFACEEAGITPDIMCVGKALTGGMMTLAATCASQEIFDEFLSEELEHALMHGPTYMGNAIACASANASLDLFEQEPRLQQVSEIEEIMVRELSKLEDLEIVEDVRIKGAFGVVELKDDFDFLKMREEFIDMGVFIRPFGNIIYLAPPYVIEEDELKKLCDAIVITLEDN